MYNDDVWKQFKIRLKFILKLVKGAWVTLLRIAQMFQYRSLFEGTVVYLVSYYMHQGSAERGLELPSTV
jgi:hypothetical protein